MVIVVVVVTLVVVIVVFTGAISIGEDQNHQELALL